MRIAIGERRAPCQRGIAYIALMIAIAVISLVAASAVQLGAVHGQRAAEDELLFVGGEFQRALSRYADATPVGLPRAPASLDELTADPRFPGAVRHLRKVYADPITGAADWEIIHDSAGRVAGVHSRSTLVAVGISRIRPTAPGLPAPLIEYNRLVFWGPGRVELPSPPGLFSRDADSNE
jgi:type II secretory pathway pseudopilin PulG